MKPTILIVDDDPAGRKVIESVLFAQGYRLEYAASGREALQKAGELRPDLILLDLMLPEMDGLEVCQRLRSDPELAEAPVVVVTALDDRNTRIACLDAGADDFITKPFDRAELRARARSITRLNRYRLLHQRDLITAWIAEKASDGYLQLHADDMILFANSRARFFLGLEMDASKPVAETFFHAILRQYRPHPETAWAGWPASAGSVQNRYLVRPESATAHEFWLEAAVFETRITEESPQTRIVRLRDVTADILNRRNTRSFGEAITHKIRTPVTQMVASLELLAKHAPKMSADDLVQFSSAALRGAIRLQDTLDRVLKYSNLRPASEGTQGLCLRNITALIQKVSGEIGLEGVDIAVSEKSLAKSLTLPLQALEVVLWETLGNSKKFHPAQTPQVRVEAFPSGDAQTTLRISDDGVSLSPKQLASVWLPYIQGEKDFTGEMPGMGLGLSTVSAIVWGAGGSCRMMNRESGGGVIVELTLPTADAPVSPDMDQAGGQR